MQPTPEMMEQLASPEMIQMAQRMMSAMEPEALADAMQAQGMDVSPAQAAQMKAQVPGFTLNPYPTVLTHCAHGTGHAEVSFGSFWQCRHPRVDLILGYGNCQLRWWQPISESIDRRAEGSNESIRHSREGSRWCPSDRPNQGWPPRACTD